MNSIAQPSKAQLAAYFLRLGFIGFGGPPAHIALMRTELVDKRGWVSPDRFARDLATANLIPGPTSTEMAIYIGYRLHGRIGALISGTLFILPAFLLVLAISALYVTWGDTGWIGALLYGIKPVALALVINGVLQLGNSIPNNWRETLVFALALPVLAFTRVDVLLVFLAGGLLFLLLNGLLPRPPAAAAFALLGGLPATAVGTVTALALFLAFLKVGAVIYGGGFALIGILQQEFVNNLGWINQRQLLDGIAIGQSTPGPVFTTATFIGFLAGGWQGAIAATIGIFLPAFAFVFLERAIIGRLGENAMFKAFLKGVNAAVVASIVVAAGQLSKDALVDVPTIAIAVLAFLALYVRKIDAHWLVAAGLGLGLLNLLLR
jgi:chromate transporter